MDNRSYSCFDKNKLLFKIQFGFRHGHSTEHARFELIEQISESFNSNNYFLGIFIAFQKPLTQKITKYYLKNYTFNGIKEKTLKSFSSYLLNKKQFIEYDKRN